MRGLTIINIPRAHEGLVLFVSGMLFSAWLCGAILTYEAFGALFLLWLVSE